VLTLDSISLGLPISNEAIEQMQAHLVITDDDLEIARKEEAKRRHDVMGHVQYVIPHCVRGSRERIWRGEVLIALTLSAFGQVAPG
jgi:adenylosuccinate lyase